MKMQCNSQIFVYKTKIAFYFVVCRNYFILYLPWVVPFSITMVCVRSMQRGQFPPGNSKPVNCPSFLSSFLPSFCLSHFLDNNTCPPSPTSRRLLEIHTGKFHVHISQLVFGECRNQCTSYFTLCLIWGAHFSITKVCYRSISRVLNDSVLNQINVITMASG